MQATDVKQGADTQEELPERFSLVAGGAFHTLLGRLGLLESDMLPSRGAALGLALIAFSIPAVFTVAQTLLEERYSGWDYFQDATVYARYLIAIFVMVFTERLADTRIVLMTQHFRDAQLLNARGRAQFSAAVTRADLQASSYRAELVIVFVAFAWSMTTTQYAAVISSESWEGVVSAGGATVLSWAGEASAFTSDTLFLFLVLRWFWRFYIWAALLKKTASLGLQIMPLHPDRCGGLGFLSIFPGIFSGLVIALSCVVAASFHKVLPELGGSEQIFWLAVATWLILVMAIFLGPLLAFVRPLYVAREAALLDYGRMAHKLHLEFHQKWVSGEAGDEELLGSVDPSSVSDLNASVQVVNEMRTFPIDRSALILLLGCAGAPLIVAAGLQMPVADLIKLILGVLF